MKIQIKLLNIKGKKGNKLFFQVTSCMFLTFRKLVKKPSSDYLKNR